MGVTVAIWVVGELILTSRDPVRGQARARLPQPPRQPAGASDDDVAAQDADLDAVVGPEREVQRELPGTPCRRAGQPATAIIAAATQVVSRRGDGRRRGSRSTPRQGEQGNR